MQAVLHARLGRWIEAGDVGATIVTRRDDRALDVHRSSHGSRERDAQCRVRSSHSIAKAAVRL
ncbi:protein of unknown function [Bradyrhizobium vignae]|uniref:Uncharacterized protein n=1 Tax=Bradyrhizobium vignae TaxID=1549949 RepID=A0A2U3PS63_9BRAD|nr:protein of unknown function [Bradyrhizobium vignae]